LKPNFCNKVALVKFYPGMDPAVIDFYVDQGFKGILLEGSGLGHVSKFCFDAIKRATTKGVVVALASQCIWGRVDMNVYDTGRDLLSFGVVPLEDMFPETGLVKLMWALGQTDNPKEAIALLQLTSQANTRRVRFRRTKSLKEDHNNADRLSKVGLKCGLEIHQQLNVGSKLFCSCPPN
jgi:L-asparaginase/Glu-tRNA(Gln) amidotransferase subunit D